MKKILAVLALFMLVLSACSKKDKKSVSEQIQGRWTLVRTHIGYYVNNNLEDEESEAYGSGDYVEFKGDGTVVSFVDGDTDESSWSLTNNDSQIVLDGETLDIKTLNSNNFHIGLTESSGTERVEMRIEMRR